MHTHFTNGGSSLIKTMYSTREGHIILHCYIQSQVVSEFYAEPSKSLLEWNTCIWNVQLPFPKEDEEEGKENKKGKGNGNWKEREEKGKVNGRQESWS